MSGAIAGHGLNLYTENLSEFIRKLFCYATSNKEDTCRIFAHNLEFDFMVIQNELKKQKFQYHLTFAKSGLIQVRVKKGSLYWTLNDSFKFYPMSLKEVGNAIQLPKLDKPEYLGFRKPETAVERDYFIRYNMRDAEIVLRAMELMLNALGNIRKTLPASTMQYFEKNYNPTFPKKKYYIEKKGHLAYCGGRVEAYYRGLCHERNFGKIRCYDINSSYPFSMMQPMPDLLTEKRRKRNIDISKLGFSRIQIKIDAEMPCLPVKTDKLYFPNGVLYGWFMNSEIKHAVDVCGAEILREYESVEYEAMPSYFSKFIQDCYKSRIRLKEEKSPLQIIEKLKMNSLYGKFGEVIRGTSFIPLTPQNISLKKRYHYIPEMNLLEIKKEGLNFGKNTHFAIAGQITAYSRLWLWKYAAHLLRRKKEIFYCDTDSIYTNGTMPESDALGGMKLEKCLSYILPIRSKLYLTNESVKAKGWHHAEQKHIEALLKRGLPLSTHSEKLSKFRESLRRDFAGNTLFWKPQNFSLISDGKRNYYKQIDVHKLMKDNTGSEAILWT